MPSILSVKSLLHAACFAVVVLSLQTGEVSPISAELQRILEADARAVLSSPLPATPIERVEAIRAEWARQFALRHDRVADLLRTHQINTRDDFFAAGAIYEYQVDAEGLLSAHRLFTAAALAGHRDAVWKSAAALDAFLVAAGRAQLFGVMLGGSRRAVQSAPDALRAHFCIPDAAQLDRAARTLVERQPGVLDRQPLSNSLLWRESALAGSRAFASPDASTTALVVRCGSPMSMSRANDFYSLGMELRGRTAADRLLAYSLLIAAAIAGHRDAAWESRRALDEFLVAIGRPKTSPDF